MFCKTIETMYFFKFRSKEISYASYRAIVQCTRPIQHSADSINSLLVFLKIYTFVFITALLSSNSSIHLKNCEKSVAGFTSLDQTITNFQGTLVKIFRSKWPSYVGVSTIILADPSNHPSLYLFVCLCIRPAQQCSHRTPVILSAITDTLSGLTFRGGNHANVTANG